MIDYTHTTRTTNLTIGRLLLHLFLVFRSSTPVLVSYRKGSPVPRVEVLPRHKVMYGFSGSQKNKPLHKRLPGSLSSTSGPTGVKLLKMY